MKVIDIHKNPVEIYTKYMKICAMFKSGKVHFFVRN